LANSEGPLATYQQWIHEHTFEPRDGGTLARDRVRYAAPLDVLVHQWLVRPDIEKIFQFRTDALRRRFCTNPARPQ
jgi:ligand-binding SRPBCC domain-containing protein